jgi:hypothetical protein
MGRDKKGNAATSRVLRCAGGPWNGQDRIVGAQGTSLAVAGENDYRYVVWQTRSGAAVLVWSDNKAAW